MSASDQATGRRTQSMSYVEEDVFLAIVLNHFDVIENKQTDKSLSAQPLRDRQSTAWKAIHSEFTEKTKVKWDFFVAMLFKLFISMCSLLVFRKNVPLNTCRPNGKI